MCWKSIRRLPNVDGQTTPGRFDDFFYDFLLLIEGERRLLKKKTTEGILENKNLVFYSVPNFFAQLSTLLHLPRSVVKTHTKKPNQQENPKH
jgi:peroxiredoxin